MTGKDLARIHKTQTIEAESHTTHTGSLRTLIQRQEHLKILFLKAESIDDTNDIVQSNVLPSKFIIMIEPNSDESSGHAKPIIGVAYVTRVMTPQKAMTYHAMSTANRAVARSTSEPAINGFVW